MPDAGGARRAGERVSSRPEEQAKPLSGRTVLIVEDEMLVAMDLEDALSAMGARIVGPALRLEAALELVDREQFDVAVLDINLNGLRSYPIADILRKRGRPFVFATGYGHAEGSQAFADVPVVTKPYRHDELIEALRAVMAGSTP